MARLSVKEAFKHGVGSEEFGEALLQYVKTLITIEYGSGFKYYEDAVGQSIIKVLEDIHAFNPELSPLPVWIKVIVRNVCTDMLRNHNHSKTTTLIGIEGHNPFSKVDKLALGMLLRILDPEEKILISEKLNGMTEKQIADKHGVNQSTVNRWLNKIEKKLRTHVGGG